MISILKKAAAGGRRAGIAVTGERVAVAVIERSDDDATLTHCHVFDGDASDWAKRTADAVANVDLKHTPITAVVEDHGYQLVLVERPQVPDDELADAVRWRIKDLVAFPTDTAVVDTLDMPALANRSSRPMLYAVAAEADAVTRQVRAIKDAGLKLDAIDIPEMCLRNVALAHPDAQFGIAFLHLEERHGTLLLARAGTLYLIRRIETGLDAVRAMTSGALTIGNVVSDLALELQRSLDYFESHYDQRPIGKVVLGPGAPASFASQLGDELGVDVESFNLAGLCSDTLSVDDDLAGAALMAVGAALRDETAEAAA